MAYGHVDQAST